MSPIKRAQIFVVIKGPVSSRNRLATKEEKDATIAARNKLIKLYNKRSELDEEIKKLRSACAHITSYDTRGWPYDTRFCAACDEGQGTI